MPALKGAGLLKGLGVTFRTMSRRSATAQYPHVRPDLPARSRGVTALVEENCTVCMLCSRECPHTVQEPDPLEEGAVGPPEFEPVRKARGAAAAKAATAAEAAREAAA